MGIGWVFGLGGMVVEQLLKGGGQQAQQITPLVAQPVAEQITTPTMITPVTMPIISPEITVTPSVQYSPIWQLGSPGATAYGSILTPTVTPSQIISPTITPTQVTTPTIEQPIDQEARPTLEQTSSDIWQTLIIVGGLIVGGYFIMKMLGKKKTKKKGWF